MLTLSRLQGKRWMFENITLWFPSEYFHVHRATDRGLQSFERRLHDMAFYHEGVRDNKPQGRAQVLE